ncbi:phage tail protein [Poseidonocella sp. HB161398]|uniref:phage tail protein n=1 Tax=Poseidonocella sp. HB161398 TaxID=2320855 RepID=UPI001108AE1F|nr:phage tail protein [Poseidonocella sp. HB161398]
MKDAQGQSYWQWCAAADFEPLGPSLRWDAAGNCLALVSSLGQAPAAAPAAAARALAQTPPVAIDAFGSWARVETGEEATRLIVGGAAEEEHERLAFPAGTLIRDMAPTAEGWLVLALGGTGGDRVLIHDLTDRFDDVALAEPGFVPDRVSAAEGAIWVADRAAPALRRLAGRPLPRPVARRNRADHVFQPEPLDPDPPRLFSPVALDLSETGEVLDAQALPDGRLALLILGAEDQSLLRLVAADGSALGDAVALGALRGAASLGLLDAGTLAVLVPGARAAVAVPLPAEGEAELPVLGLRLPLRDHDGGRFCRGVPGAALHYPAAAAGRPVARLVALSRPSYARAGQARSRIAEADTAGTVWHRIYIEAHLPQGCGVTLRLAAGDDRAALERLGAAEMALHRFGATPGTAGPQGVWLDFDSEKPFLASATGMPRRRDRCGLFSALVQKSEGPVRRVAGRYLRVDLEFHGSGLATPKLHALRVWGPRRSWRDRYLPDYLSVEAGPQAEGSNFLDRYLALFEGLLTPLEDQVAASWRLTRPDVAPADALDWLAGWIGAELPGALPLPARRHLLANTVQLWRRRGTLPGLRKMLEIVTEGGVSRGEIVVLEHYHLRRTFATILGADLSDAGNPLTPWAGRSGNSHLGPTFFLGEEDEKAFFALFRPSLLDDPLTTAEERAAALEDLAEFFDSHAHRITVLIHGGMDDARRAQIARVLDREVPAHVHAVIAEGPGSMVLGISSLVAVDSRLAPPPAPGELTLGSAQLGQAYLSDLPSLDPRYEGGA